MIKLFRNSRLRLLASLSLASLLLAACGSSEDTQAPTGGNEDNAEAGENTEAEPTLGDPGVLLGECNSYREKATFSLHSIEDAGEITSVVFNTSLATPDESSVLSHGRAAQPHGEVEFPDDCTHTLLLPERELALVSFTEDVNGNSVTGFGVLDEEGTFTALNPEQEVSDFDAPTQYLHPRLDTVGDRILYVEKTEEEDGGTVQAMDLDSGDITEVGPCEQRTCEDLAVQEVSGTAVFHDRQYRTTLSPDASFAVVNGGGHGDTRFVDRDDLPEGEPLQLNYGVIDDSETSEISTEGLGDGVAHVIDEMTVLFDNNQLSVLEFTWEELEEYAQENSSVPHYEWEDMPMTRDLVPGDTRDNSQPTLSPDRTEVLFHSVSDTGEASWYRVPTDGSGEPEEVAAAPEDLNTILAWQ